MTWLTPADLYRMTKRRRYAAQRRALDRLGVPYTAAADGEPLVRTDTLDAYRRPARNRGPRWERIGA